MDTTSPLLRTAGTGRTVPLQESAANDPIHALQLDNISSMNVWLSIGACAYASICLVLLLINFLQCKKPYFDVFNQGCPNAPLTVTSDNVHRIEFTSAFYFNCVNLLIVAYSSNKAKFTNPGLFKTWAFMNLLFSSTAMILVWANRPLFEVPSHQMEYTAEISMTFLETKLLMHGIEKVEKGWRHSLASFLNWVPSLLAILQIIVFNKGSLFFDVKDWSGECSFWGYQIRHWMGDQSCHSYGDAGGEWYGHCLEYIVGTMNATQAFFISLDNKMDADTLLQGITRKFTEQDECCGSDMMSTPMARINESSDEKDRRIQDLERQLEEMLAEQSARNSSLPPQA